MMDNQMSKYVFENSQVDIIEIGGKPMFEIYSTGMALGYTNYGKNKKNPLPHKSRIETVMTNADIQGCVHGVNTYLSENELYDFMLEAHTQKCKSFRKWLTAEVLPTIRKTGGYVMDDREDEFINHYFSSFSESTKLNMVQDLKRQNNEYRKQTEQQKPLVDFAKQIGQSNDTIDMLEMSKVACKNGIKIGRNNLFKLLRSNDIIMCDNQPYQRYIDWFEVIEQVNGTGYNAKIGFKPLITVKGQAGIIKLLMEKCGEINNVHSL